MKGLCVSSTQIMDKLFLLFSMKLVASILYILFENKENFIFYFDETMKINQMYENKNTEHFIQYRI